MFVAAAITGVALNGAFASLVLDFTSTDLGGFETDVVLDAVVFLGFLAIIPAFEATDEIASDTAEAFERNVAFIFFASTGRAAMTRDDTREATNWVTIDGVVDRAIADARFFHLTDDSLEGFDVLGWVAVKLNVGDVPSIAKCVIWSFDFDFLEGRNWIVNGDMEGVGVVVAISDTFNVAVFFAVDFREAASDTFSRSGEEREV